MSFTQFSWGLETECWSKQWTWEERNPDSVTCDYTVWDSPVSTVVQWGLVMASTSWSYWEDNNV